MASTGYCLADPGQAYLVYVPAAVSSSLTTDFSRPLTVNLTGAAGEFVGEWIDLEQSTSMPISERVEGGGERLLRVPFRGAGLLYVYRLKD